MTDYKDVAEKINVKIGDVFKVKSSCMWQSNEVYKLTENGLVSAQNGEWTKSELLDKIISGEYQVVMFPWQMTLSDTYWTVTDGWDIEELRWHGDRDYMYLTSLKLGIVYWTKADAEKGRNFMYKELTGEEWAA